LQPSLFERRVSHVTISGVPALFTANPLQLHRVRLVE
jgi:hypothetical protein